MEQQIKLVQKPIIQHALVEIGKSVTNRISELNLEHLVATEETVQSLKKLRIELNKEFEDYEAQRKTIKEAVANPYMEFEAVYKTEISEKYKKAVETIKDKIAIVEDKIKADKKANVIRYFAELCASENIDFLKFEDTKLEINLSTSEKAYKDKCNEFVQRVADDILLIQVQPHTAEIMAEYKKTLNCSKAITAVTERKEAEKLEAERIKQTETNRRKNLLRGLCMVYSNITRVYYYVEDETIYITESDIENLPKEEFQKRFVEIESKVTAFRKSQEKAQPTPVVNQPTVPVPAKEQPAPVSVPEPLQSPVVAPAPEKTFTAAFEVIGTMAQLTALSQYMKSNNLTYKNI